jgi:CheY-like chemotaxis protein
MGASELLGRTALSDEQRPLLQTLRRSGRALLVIIDGILDFSQMESGALRIERAPFDPGSLLAELCDGFEPLARSKGLRFVLDDTAARPCWVDGDASRVRQVLANLIDNAIKFTPRGSVKLGLGPAVVDANGHRLLRFSVRDTGIGVTSAQRDALFRPFVQGEGSFARRFGGAGLGLAIAQRLCNLMGGRIGVDPEPGGGSCFWIELPLSAQPERAPALSAAGASLRSVGISVRVLLVEDTEVNALVIQAQLAQLGCSCDVASDGEQALHMLERNRYDLVFMDCMMPGIDGYEVTRRVRLREQAQGTQRVPIVALTANAMIDGPALSRRAGMDDHMSKPCSIEGLAAAIERWANKAHA